VSTGDELLVIEPARSTALDPHAHAQAGAQVQAAESDNTFKNLAIRRPGDKIHGRVPVKPR